MSVRRVGGASRKRAAIDRCLGPTARLLERHEVDVRAPPPRVLEEALAVPLRELPVVRALFRIRGIPFDASMTIREFFTTPPFSAVAEEPGREFVFVVARAGIAATGNLLCEPGPGGSVLSTETWIETRGRWARAGFAIYWTAIGRFSAWIRRMILAAAKRRAERPSGAPR